MKKSFTGKNKILEGMKRCTVQVVIAVAVGTLAFAHDNFAQVLDKKITITLKEVPLEEALDAVGAAAGVKFFYSIDQLNIKDKLTVRAVNQSLKEVLEKLLSPYHVRYKVHEKKLEITLKREDPASRSELGAGDSGGWLAFPSPATAPATITGTVTDAITQQPMAGVNIVIRGTTEGTSTDAAGAFSIWATEHDVLIFSFIGYKSYETQVGDRSQIDVAMEEDVTGLQEVEVNAGYWKVEDKERTGNIIRVTAEEIRKHPVSNPIAALQGKVPGLEIIQESGVPGGNFRIRIRGQNSIANGNDPLIIIDGVPYLSTTMAFNETSSGIFGNAAGVGGSSPLNAINPADIESIEILKDADATAIYGSRGANGVILITTKKGTIGNVRVDLNLYRGVGTVASRMDLLSIAQFSQMRKEALKNSNLVPDQVNAPDLTVWDTTVYRDWQKELIGGKANTVDAQLSISGGEKTTQFLIGVGYHREGTVFPGSYADSRLSTHISLNNTSRNQKFSSGVSLKYIVNDSDLIKQDLTSLALTLPPVSPPLYNANGDLNWGTKWGTNSWTRDFPHPLAYLKTSYQATTKNLLANSTLAYSIMPDLQARVNMGFSDITMNAVTLVPKASFAPTLAATKENESVFATSNFNNWTVEPQLNWKPPLLDGRMDVLLGATFLEQVQEGLAQYAYGFTDEPLMKNIGAASSRTFATNYYSQYRYTSLFGRINYVFRKKYIVNATGRRDGSSRFGPNNQFANFGAVGVAWLFSQEDFLLNHFSALSFGKIRASYGITGNDQLGNYQYLDTYTSSGLYQGIKGLTPVRLANPSFAWETNVKAEGALELGFLNNRILTSVNYYRNISSNQLVGFSLPPTTGFNTVQGNLPAVILNTGVEFEVTTRNIVKSNFTWNTSVNFSIPRNKLVEFPNLKASPSYSNTLVEGQPLNILKRYNYLEVDPQTGLYRFEDMDGNGTINLLDKKSIKFIGQDFYGGIQNSLSYKGFELDLFFQFVKQTKLNYLSLFVSNPGQGLSNQPEWVMNRWQREGDIKETQVFSTSTAAHNAYTPYTQSTKAVSDASYIRLKNISLSYSPQTTWLQTVGLASARIFIQGQNLFTITRFKGLDPEPSSPYSLPPLRVISGGISISL